MGPIGNIVSNVRRQAPAQPTAGIDHLRSRLGGPGPAPGGAPPANLGQDAIRQRMAQASRAVTSARAQKNPQRPPDGGGQNWLFNQQNLGQPTAPGGISQPGGPGGQPPADDNMMYAGGSPAWSDYYSGRGPMPGPGGAQPPAGDTTYQPGLISQPGGPGAPPQPGGGVMPTTGLDRLRELMAGHPQRGGFGGRQMLAQMMADRGFGMDPRRRQTRMA